MLTLDTGSDTTEEYSPIRQSIARRKHSTSRKTRQARFESPNQAQEAAELNSKGSLVSEEGASLNTLSSSSCVDGTPASAEQSFNPLQCLFCNVECTSLNSTLSHMSQAHSFFIPEPEYLIDVESFLSYLFVIISVFHECLLCGSSRSTKFGVQDHMRGKGHCRVDLEDEQNQFKQFYDFSGDIDAEAVDLDEEVILIPDEDKLHLPSGKTLGHRLDVHHSRRTRSERSSPRSYSRQQLLTEPESDMEPAESKDRRIVMRAGTTTSMIGVPEPQRRALVAVEKKMLTIETIARNEYQSILEKGGNKQKFYRALGIGKKMGGLEKRLG